MKKNYKKIAFTIAEILMALGISAVIAVIFFKNVKTANTHYANSLGAYSAFKNLETVANDLATNPGCSSADLAQTPTPYCVTAKSLPSFGHSSSNTRGFCDRLVNEEFNTTGAVNCDQTAIGAISDATDFKTATPNFVTTNGMRFFNVGALPTATISDAVGYYSIYVDIDGTKRNGKLNEDVIKFLVLAADGSVIPDASSIAANNIDYLSASAWYNDGTKDVYVFSSVPYRQAACAASSLSIPNPFPFIGTDYCSTSPSQPQASACNSHSCSFDYAKPKMLGSFGS